MKEDGHITTRCLQRMHMSCKNRAHHTKEQQKVLSVRNLKSVQVKQEFREHMISEVDMDRHPKKQ